MSIKKKNTLRDTISGKSNAKDTNCERAENMQTTQLLFTTLVEVCLAIQQLTFWLNARRIYTHTPWSDRFLQSPCKQRIWNFRSTKAKIRYFCACKPGKCLFVILMGRYFSSPSEHTLKKNHLCLCAFEYLSHFHQATKKNAKMKCRRSCCHVYDTSTSSFLFSNQKCSTFLHHALKFCEC